MGSKELPLGYLCVSLCRGHKKGHHTHSKVDSEVTYVHASATYIYIYIHRYILYINIVHIYYYTYVVGCSPTSYTHRTLTSLDSLQNEHACTYRRQAQEEAKLIFNLTAMEQ